MIVVEAETYVRNCGSALLADPSTPHCTTSRRELVGKELVDRPVD
jgi:hypothetical protein